MRGHTYVKEIASTDIVAECSLSELVNENIIETASATQESEKEKLMVEKKRILTKIIGKESSVAIKICRGNNIAFPRPFTNIVWDS